MIQTMNNSVTVIIPTHNRAHTLVRALNSVLAQTQPANEIIVVDDGSTDETKQLLADHYPQVRCMSQRKKGVSASRNSGIKQATSEWIALLDSDDSWHKNKLEQQWLALSAEPNLLCHTDEIWIRHSKRVNPKIKHTKSSENLFERSLELCLISPSSVLIHRSLFDKVGYFDENLPACEDYDLWLRITAKHQTTFVKQALITKYGGHEDQLSRQFWGMDRFRIRALQKCLNTIALTPRQADSVKTTIKKKATILRQGAIKRHNKAWAAELQCMIDEL